MALLLPKLLSNAYRSLALSFQPVKVLCEDADDLKAPLTNATVVKLLKKDLGNDADQVKKQKDVAPPPTTPLVFETSFKDVRHVDRTRVQFLSRLSAQAWVPPSQRAPKHQTVIIFDWDDTLLYTSFLNQYCQNVAPDALKTVLPAPIMCHLQHIERTARQLLENAVSLGHTFIITNAERGWVEDTAQLYMPSLVPLFEKIRIVSARSTQEARSHGDMRQWKVRAFLELGQQFDPQCLTNLVSIGDSNMELEAALALGRRLKGFTKTVKLLEKPSPAELVKQLDFLAPNLQSIVEDARNFNKKLAGTHEEC